MQDELIPALNAGIDRLGLGDIRLQRFKAQEESREHDWTQDPTGGNYRSRLGARYGSALPPQYPATTP